MNNEEKIKTIGEKIKGIRTAVFVTTDGDGSMHSRPMSTQDVDFDGSVWFMTSKDSKKVRHIKGNPNVNLSYSAGSASTFVSLAGKALLVDDPAKVHELWNDFYKAWFKGEDDPKIQLLRVDVEKGEYWDHPGGMIGNYFDAIRGAITGTKIQNEEHERVNL